MDTISKKKRSEIMKAIRGKDSKIEILLRRQLKKQGLRYKSNVANLPGKPDVAFVNKRTVVFLDSCFWHGCGKHCRLPSSNKEYWNKKIERNKSRDKVVNKRYKIMGWKALRFWEHALMRSPEGVAKKIRAAMEGRKPKD